MHVNKRYIALILLVAAIAALFSLPSREAPTPSILLIVPNATDSYWRSVCEGASAAANRLHVRLITCETDKNDNALQMINEYAVSSLVAAPTDNLASILSVLSEATLPSVFLCSSQTHPSIVSRVLSVAKADQAFDDVILSAVGFQARIAIICGDANDESAREKELELRRQLGGAGVKIERVYSNGDSDAAYDYARAFLANESISVILALGLPETEALVHAARDQASSALLLGYDVSPEIIAAIEDGTLYAVSVRNAFSIGYQGVKTAHDALKGEKVMYDVLVYSLLATRENLYDPDSERVIFSLIGE